jgi:hypothetical protein
VQAAADTHRSRAAASAGVAFMDDRTWTDLDMDAVFCLLDRTESTLGRDALYHRLRTVPTQDDLDSFEALVERMTTDTPGRERARRALGRLRDQHGYDHWWLEKPEALETGRWFVLLPMLSLITIVLLALLLTPLWPRSVPLLILAVIASLFVRFSGNSRMFNLAPVFRQLAPIITTAQALRFLGGEDIQSLTGPLQSETPRLGRLKTIARWVSGDPLMLSTSPSPLAIILSDFCNTLYDYLNVALLLDANGVYFGGSELRARSGSLLRVVAAIGNVDAAISVAAFRASTGVWTRPRFLPAGATATLREVRHPLVEKAVPNTIVLAPGHGALVTGSNMSGKSTFLRTIGVAVVMAQTLHTCLAEEYAAPALLVRSCIGRADDLLAGKSYYIVEVESLLGLVQASVLPVPHLFLLDELFRGTNAVERIAAGQAVLEALLMGDGSGTLNIVLAATHDGELVDLLPGEYASYHFGDAIGDAGITFDHRLQSGPATTRNAIALLRIHGAPERLVARATDCAVRLDRQRRITPL